MRPTFTVTFTIDLRWRDIALKADIIEQLEVICSDLRKIPEGSLLSELRAGRTIYSDDNKECGEWQLKEKP